MLDVVTVLTARQLRARHAVCLR